MALQVNDVQGAIRVLEAYERMPDGYGSDNPQIGQGPGKDSLSADQGAAVSAATWILNDYAMKGGDVSGVPQSIRKYTTPEYANFIASRSSTKFRDYLPLIATLGGGLAGVFGGAAGAAGAGGSQAAGTEAAATYGAGGEFGSGATTFGGGTAAGSSLAEQSASIGSGSTAGTTAGTGVGTGTATTGTTANTLGTTAGGTALSRILGGTATESDYLELAGQVGPSVLSAIGSKQQADASKALSDKLFAMGEPYRNKLLEITNDPSKFYDSPAATKATESVLQRLSATHGNPAGSPYAQQLTIDALFDNIGEERDRLAGHGGLINYNAAAPGAATNAIDAKGSIYSDIGYGVGNVLNPPPKQMTLADLLRNARV